MLKGLILAGLLIVIWVLVQGTVFQLRAPQKAFASMVAWFAPMVPAFVLLYVLTPADLGFLPERFARAAPALGLLNGLAMLVLLFLTGVLFGVEVLMQDRLDTMAMNGFLVRRDGRYHLAPKGRLGGLGGTIARRVLTMKAL